MRRLRSPAWLLGGAALVLVLLTAAAVSYVISVREREQNGIESADARLSRLLGYAQAQSALQAASTETLAATAKYAYAASKDASQSGNDAQQRVRTLLGSAGLEVSSIQLLPVRSVGRFDRIPISVRAEGSLLELQAAVAALPMSAPTLFVEAFSLQGVGLAAATSPVRVVAEIEFFVLRARP